MDGLHVSEGKEKLFSTIQKEIGKLGDVLFEEVSQVFSP